MKDLDVGHLMEKSCDHTWMHNDALNFYLPKNLLEIFPVFV